MLMLLMQAIIELSKRKSEMLQNLGDSLLRAEELEKKLQEKMQFASRLQMKLDGTVAEYRTEIQKLTAEKDTVVAKNKSLHHEKQGNILLLRPTPSTYLDAQLTC